MLRNACCEPSCRNVFASSFVLQSGDNGKPLAEEYPAAELIDNALRLAMPGLRGDMQPKQSKKYELLKLEELRAA